jgi:hypothetical protein
MYVVLGFNGMERDDDINNKSGTPLIAEGLGNSYDFGARIYDPRGVKITKIILMQIRIYTRI